MTPREIKPQSLDDWIENEREEMIREERDVDHWRDREQDIETEREYDDYKDFYPDRDEQNEILFTE